MKQSSQLHQLQHFNLLQEVLTIVSLEIQSERYFYKILMFLNKTHRPCQLSQLAQ